MSTPYKRPHSDTYKDKSDALKRKVKANPDRYPCWICKQPIDTSLPWKHPMSYTYDHNKPLAKGGDARGDGRQAHRSCNSRRGDGSNIIEHIQATNVSIDWLAGPDR